ncbi:MAG: hypothetical protein K0S12_725 [Bacteroidetes bacterium]|nr:hypothetical protein [Bacteroidota bacterium]
MQGLLVNGVPIYDDGDGKSYNSTTNTNANNGAGVWNQIAWKAHLSEMDAGMGHPDPNNVYHNHSNPLMLCSVTSATAHSPIIGWSFDGWPIYGPFGYSTATSSTSAITRMTSCWSLRSISTRTALYTGVATSQTGPPVSSTFPIGTYIEDYQYTVGTGMLDYYNGRYCVTPEFPSGTYAYFLNTDAAGNAQYPNMIGPKYYSSVFMANFGTSGGNASAPAIGKVCYTPLTTDIAKHNVSLNSTVYPNPTSNLLHLNYSGGSAEIEVYNALGQLVRSLTDNTGVVDLSDLTPAIYHLRIVNDGKADNHMIIKQ